MNLDTDCSNHVVKATHQISSLCIQELHLHRLTFWLEPAIYSTQSGLCSAREDFFDPGIEVRVLWSDLQCFQIWVASPFPAAGNVSQM